ncbi:MAG: DNA adenine methylase [Clostridiaceae bacterium]|nr:DNA adenine methylase [Clostridiaceae bacterium]
MSGESYFTAQLITCLGNKRTLTPYLLSAADRVRAALGRDLLAVGDLFSGSGAAARVLKTRASRLVVNDLERYAEVLSRCYLSNAADRDEGALRDSYARLRNLMEGPLESGFLTELYAPEDDRNIRPGERVFYTNRNARYLDTCRQAIAALPECQQPFFLAPLLAEASVKTNTSGVFKGFYKDVRGIGKFGGAGENALSRVMADIALPFPVFGVHDCPVEIYREDAGALAKSLPPLDLLYLDPPYNQHPYGSNYFMLNLLCDYRRPERLSRVSGIPEGWNRSDYNRRKAALPALLRLCGDAQARYILLSFNSEGFVEKDVLLASLSQLGETEVTEIRYNAFRGSRNLHQRPIHVKEYLFLIRKG